MSCQSTSRVVASLQMPSRAWWLSRKIVRKAVSKLFESVGGRLIEWYLTFGRHDWLVIGEFPDDKAAAAAVLAAAAGGSLSDVETTPAMTAEDAHGTFVSAGKAAKAFRSAGHA